ncbi:DUF1761 domain-containing protein [Devosia sp. XJ19-1]|uniref:DUF1761 domain-containing protein n=1 Tax=Devosia ureilytica TaxID=2952754 RepID=A0A9Q4AN38_9HYPH|nr:DUF1761 domain-containing protein [Devosia ureilytica]MCP8882818.1 DUF1761 domain-containing protein [Devosia ureilytica]MCP8886814.1 DUF1761 domain-containing protein [Devosia ureilytica]
MNYLGVNWLAVILATVASFAFGAVWYMGLSKQWMNALGKTKDQLQVGNTPFIWSALVELVMAFFVALFTIAIMGEVTIANAVLVGVHLWLGFVITTLIMNHRYEGMKWSLTIIDGLHILGVLVIQGVVIGLFG